MSRRQAQPTVETAREQAEFSDTARAAYACAVGWGWHVCPIVRNSRATYKTEETHGTPWGATNDPGQVIKDFRQWPHADIAVACGPSRIVVIDVDSTEGHEHDGFASLAELEAAHGPLPATHVASTPHNGRHRWYAAPPGVKITTKRIAPGVEVLAQGSMVPVPPARGRRWIERPSVELAELPRAWVDLMRDAPEPQPRAPRRAPAPRVGSPMSPEIRAMLVADAGKGLDIPDDERLKCHIALRVLDADCPEPEWFRFACCIYEGFPNETGFELFHVWSQRARWKYQGENNCRAKWKQIAKGKRKLKARGKTPRALGTIYDAAFKIDPTWWDTYDRLLRRRAKQESVS